MRIRLLLLLLALLAPTASWAQSAVFVCVQLSSGIDRCAPVSATNPLPTQGTASGTPSNVNLTQILGAAPSLTNPLWVTPATGATFPVSGTFFQATQPISAASGAIVAGAQVDLLTMRGTVAGGTAAANSLLGGAVYNSTAPAVTNGQQVADQVDTTGSRQVNTEGRKATYSASGTIVPASAATDVATITGSASKTIRVTRIQLSGQATAATPVIFSLIKRSAANSGGTSAALTAIPLDSGNAAASATLLNYSVNPTPGAAVGTIRYQQMVLVPSTTPATPNVPITWDFTTRNGQGVVLRGTSQVLAVNYGGATVSGNVLAFDIEWTEE